MVTTDRPARTAVTTGPAAHVATSRAPDRLLKVCEPTSVEQGIEPVPEYLLDRVGLRQHPEASVLHLCDRLARVVRVGGVLLKVTGNRQNDRCGDRGAFDRELAGNGFHDRDDGELR